MAVEAAADPAEAAVVVDIVNKLNNLWNEKIIMVFSFHTI